MRVSFAVTVVGAALIAGCGGSKSATTSSVGAPPSAGSAGAVKVTLRLKAADKRPASACGTTHRTARYVAGAVIRFAGSVTPPPSGPYRVKVRVKVCRGAVFLPVTEVRAVLRKREGAFTGTLPKLPRGSYSARATLIVGAGHVARSEKRHFAIG